MKYGLSIIIISQYFRVHWLINFVNWSVGVDLGITLTRNPEPTVVVTLPWRASRSVMPVEYTKAVGNTHCCVFGRLLFRCVRCKDAVCYCSVYTIFSLLHPWIQFVGRAGGVVVCTNCCGGTCWCTPCCTLPSPAFTDFTSRTSTESKCRKNFITCTF